MKKTLKSIIITIYLCLILLYFILNYNFIINKILNYTNIFINNIFPSTFIFYIMSNLIIEYSNNINIKINKLYVFILSILSGFPTGVNNIKELYLKNKLDINTSNKYIMFTHFPNIIFVLSTCMKIINNRNITIKLLLSLFISNFIIFIFCKNKISLNNNTYNNNDFSKILSNSIKKTINIIIIIYGTSIFFYLLSFIITKPINNIYLNILINGLIDLSKGIYLLNLLNNDYIKSIYLLLFLSFGTISIHIQTKSILQDTSINYNYYLIGRIISTTISILIFIILSLH